MSHPHSPESDRAPPDTHQAFVFGVHLTVPSVLFKPLDPVQNPLLPQLVISRDIPMVQTTQSNSLVPQTST